MLVCVRCRKLQGVSVWAPEEGGPRPGLPDTGGKAKHLALILTRILVHAHTHTHAHACLETYTHMQLSTSWLPSVNRCFLPSSPTHTTSHIQTHKCSASPGTPTGWPRGRVQGQLHPSVLFSLMLDPVQVSSPGQKRLQFRYQGPTGQEINFCLPADLTRILDSDVYQTFYYFTCQKLVLTTKRSQSEIWAELAPIQLKNKSHSFHYGLNL